MWLTYRESVQITARPMERKLIMNYKIQLENLHCDSCKKIVEKRLGRIEGVTSVKVTMEDQTALVQTEHALSLLQAETVLKDTDYKVTAFTEI